MRETLIHPLTLYGIQNLFLMYRRETNALDVRASSPSDWKCLGLASTRCSPSPTREEIKAAIKYISILYLIQATAH